MIDEHTAFTSVIDSLREAESMARTLQALRADQPWVKVADKLKELQDYLLRMVGEGHIGGLRQ